MDDVQNTTGYEVWLDDRHVIGYLGQDNVIHYDTEKMNTVVTEMIAGQSGKTSGRFSTTARVVYRYDGNRKKNNDTIWSLWKSNPIMQNRITQLNALTFGRGFRYMYDADTQAIIDRFWRVNQLRTKLGALSTDAQLYGEVFIGLFHQASGDVLVGLYEPRLVDIDFNPINVFDVNRYIITYRDEETNKDEQFDMMPIEKYLAELEMQSPIGKAVSKVRKALGLKGATGIKGKGVMCHVKFNTSSGQIHGTSDFYQTSDILGDYMGFVGDRLTIHQLYGSPAYDITIDTTDTKVIQDRIDDLAGFTIGSNPVHNKSETWTPLEFKNGALVPTADEKILRGLICAGLGFPEYLLFNQNEVNGNDNTFSVTKIAEDRQDSFADTFTNMHKFAVAIAGGDPLAVDDGQLIFPEINMMSEKAKAETYVLKVGSNICSRRTAAAQMGHNWDIEVKQILDEAEILAPLMEDSDTAGVIGGRFTSRKNNSASTDPGDDGSGDRKKRADATRVKTTQVVRSEKQRD